MSVADLRDVMETMFFGPAGLTRAVVPRMRAQGWGRRSDQLDGRPGDWAGRLTYCAAKFALEGLSEAVAAEVAPFGIRVLIVEPGRSAPACSAVACAPHPRSSSMRRRSVPRAPTLKAKPATRRVTPPRRPPPSSPRPTPSSRRCGCSGRTPSTGSAPGTRDCSPSWPTGRTSRAPPRSTPDRVRRHVSHRGHQTSGVDDGTSDGCSSANASIAGRMQKSCVGSSMRIPPFALRREPRPTERATRIARKPRLWADCRFYVADRAATALLLLRALEPPKRKCASEPTVPATRPWLRETSLLCQASVAICAVWRSGWKSFGAGGPLDLGGAIGRGSLVEGGRGAENASVDGGGGVVAARLRLVCGSATSAVSAHRGR